jgi:hypothetical protein
MRSEQVRAEAQANVLAELHVSPRTSLPPLSLFIRRARVNAPPIVEHFFNALKHAAYSSPIASDPIAPSASGHDLRKAAP